MKKEKAILAAGCFWGVEELLREYPGVLETEVGYCGGQAETALYKKVCEGTTNHAEAVQITFDSEKLSYERLLHAFYKLHDPTTLNQQHNDKGTQYRSAIFPHSTAQRAEAEAAIARNQTDWDDPIVTSIEDDAPWYKAEAYHQQYYANNPNAGYCAAVVGPKMRKFRQGYAARLKAA